MVSQRWLVTLWILNPNLVHFNEPSWKLCLFITTLKYFRLLFELNQYFPSKISTLTLTHSCTIESFLCAAEAKLPANDTGRKQVPAIITHRPPLAAFQHLDPTFSQSRTSFQSHVALHKHRKLGKYLSRLADIYNYCYCGCWARTMSMVFRKHLLAINVYYFTNFKMTLPKF